MKVWYLMHSGFAVETDSHFLIFDYYKDEPAGGGLDQGVISPEEIAGKNVLVFVSHRHADHFSRHIFRWRPALDQVRYILSSDVKTREQDILRISGGQTLELGDVAVSALTSTDQGVAFVVEVDGARIYHAGDLNWWHWDEETEDYNAKMAQDYKGQIDLLRGVRLDLAFVPCDPRLEGAYALGLRYLLDTADVRAVAPMHLWEDYAIFDRLARDLPAGQREKIIRYSRRGEKREL